MDLRFNAIDVDTALRRHAEALAPGFKASEVKWRNGVASVVLAPEGGSVPQKLVLLRVGEKKISVIKEVRALTGLGLKEAKDLTESTLPVCVHIFTDPQRARAAVQAFEAAGATVGLL
jgi:ribosomal protein L7/L12